MRPKNFVESNYVFKGDGADVSDLNVLRTKYGSYSCWQLTEEDLNEVMHTGCVWLAVLGSGHPAVLVMAEEPPEVTMERHARMLANDTRMRIETAS